MNAITSATLCCLGLALASGPAWAETLVYDPVGGTTDPSTFGPFLNSKNSHWGNGAYIYSGSLVPPTIDKNGYNITIKSTSPGSHLTTFAGAYGHGAVDIAGNRLSIENNTTEALAFAGFNTSNNVSHNALTVSGGKLSAAHGGYVSEKGHAIGNRATFSGGSIVYGLHGGLTYKGDANDNTVTILNQAAPSAHYVVGGQSWSEGNANGNTVNMSGGKINQNIEGGASFTKGHADGNSVTVSGGTVGNYIYGGINRDYLHSGNANKNTVTVSGGTVGAVIGGSAWGDADGNSVTVSGGKVLQIIGGRSLSNDTSASSNTVTVSGGKIEGSIVGGEAATALNNVVNILGAPVIGGSIRGNTSNGEAAEISGNTLNIATKGLRLTKPIENFEWINFYLPSHIAANDTVVTISEELRAKHSKLGVAMQDGGVLAHGDKVTLVDASGGLGWISEFPQDLSNHFNHPANTRKLSAMTLDTQYEFTLSEDGKKIVATALIAASKPSPNPAPNPAPAPAPAPGAVEHGGNPIQKAMLEPGIASQAALNQAVDFVSASAMQAAVQAAQSTGTFAALAGNSIRSESGSHVDSKGASLAMGVAARNNKLLYGAFFEYGRGNYDAYNSFSFGHVEGGGKTHYYGAGLLGKFDLLADFYVDGSIRGGKIKTEYAGRNFARLIGFEPGYSSKRSYFGAHLGVGKFWQFGEKSQLETYAKALFNHLGADDFSAGANTYRLDSAQSVRAKVGARYGYAMNDKSTLYVGAAYEREFDGKAKGKNTRFNTTITAPSMKGDSYIGEVGYNVKAVETAKGKLSIDLNLQGTTGKKEGVAGGANVKWEF